MKPDIANRADLNDIVVSFYSLVRSDEVLSPIFEKAIDDWDEHLEKITDFWNIQLFQVKGYTGNPIQTHQQVDEANDYSITPELFGKWLFYWMNTINERFEGPTTELLKERTRKMQTVLYLKMFEKKQQKSI